MVNRICWLKPLFGSWENLAQESWVGGWVPNSNLKSKLSNQLDKDVGSQGQYYRRQSHRSNHPQWNRLWSPPSLKQTRQGMYLILNTNPYPIHIYVFNSAMKFLIFVYQIRMCEMPYFLMGANWIRGTSKQVLKVLICKTQIGISFINHVLRELRVFEEPVQSGSKPILN